MFNRCKVVVIIPIVEPQQVYMEFGVDYFCSSCLHDFSSICKLSGPKTLTDNKPPVTIGIFKPINISTSRWKIYTLPIPIKNVNTEHGSIYI